MLEHPSGLLRIEGLPLESSRELGAVVFREQLPPGIEEILDASGSSEANLIGSEVLGRGFHRLTPLPAAARRRPAGRSGGSA